ncbi:syntaxin [Cordyceps fumosorosea ARSEF 2679]|uniref:Syntaxin n=1 Tax=Cordyceps fumosorosea (strain ARSEF 2679) TaxID=1081104 RepID=A0A167UF71_CORFA|nr:syntaxin [Cordyceps fumosorosea ARSEF 2679]OAA61526.1 syntaxin [Cordyceps fumosorosea ARSEF 2679]
MEVLAPPTGNRTAEFNELLSKHNAPPATARADIDKADSFLKEAYRINSHITTLHKELRDVRQAYLSTAQPRRTQPRAGQPRGTLTDREREEVDANAKQMIRELNASIRAVDDAEQLRRETAAAVARKAYGGALGTLGSWASGSAAGAERAAVEGRARQTEAHRDAVLWFLRQRLEGCCRTQQGMMETRLTRELERSRGFLAAPPPAADFADFARATTGSGGAAAAASEGLTEDQVQMFEEGNRDMMKHYESTLAKVQTAERSLVEISELQSLLVNNLAIQSAHIEQLVADSLSTAENVGGGNKELKKAAQRPSTARYTFFAASGLCAFLVLWDLII